MLLVGISWGTAFLDLSVIGSYFNVVVFCLLLQSQKRLSGQFCRNSITRQEGRYLMF